MFAQPTRYISVFSTSSYSLKSAIQNVCTVLLASLLLSVVSQIAIPWQPVPLTFQSAMVVLLGVTLGSKRAAIAVALYLFEGGLGLPVFANGAAGWSVLMGPTAGYLWGFVPAAYFSGFLMEKGMAKGYLSTFFTVLMGDALIFLCGSIGLMTFMSFKMAFMVGVQPFLITESAKLILVSFLGKLSFKSIG